jgi:hypothetical protein
LFKLSIKVLTDSELVCLKLLHEAHGSKKKLPNQNKNQTKKYNNFITYLPLKEIFPLFLVSILLNSVFKSWSLIGRTIFSFYKKKISSQFWENFIFLSLLFFKCFFLYLNLLWWNLLYSSNEIYPFPFLSKLIHRNLSNTSLSILWPNWNNKNSMYSFWE